jgi:hypothetical protein
MSYAFFSGVNVDKSEMINKILSEDDFIHAPKFGNSLQKFLAKTDHLLENGAIGRLLLIPPEEVERIYEESVKELKKEMNPDGDSGL